MMREGGAEMRDWIVGAVMGAIALFGLMLASQAHEGAFYWFGLALFALGVIAIFGMILRATGQPPRRGDLDPSQP